MMKIKNLNHQKISIICVSQKASPKWLNDYCNDYLQRFNTNELQLNIFLVKPANRSNEKFNEANKQRWLKFESEKILEVIQNIKNTHKNNNIFLILLDERGQSFTTQKLKLQFEELFDLHKEIILVIGGPDGLADDLKNKANLLMRLSDLTLPHGLAKLLLIEQIYRIFTLIKGHPYHRE